MWQQVYCTLKGIHCYVMEIRTLFNSCILESPSILISKSCNVLLSPSLCKSILSESPALFKQRDLGGAGLIQRVQMGSGYFVTVCVRLFIFYVLMIPYTVSFACVLFSLCIQYMCVFVYRNLQWHTVLWQLKPGDMVEISTFCIKKYHIK